MNKNLIRAKDIEAMPENIVQHQFNDNAVRRTKTLTTNTGMQRIGIHLIVLGPGLDSTTHHYHEADEEFIYILQGHGIARIGQEEFECGPGDFMGFPAPSEPHSLTNPSDEDMVYLVGGERMATDIVHYPDLQRSMVKAHGRRAWFDWDDLTDLPPRA